MHEQSGNCHHVLRALQNRGSWGLYAVLRYLERRGVPLYLYRLAERLRDAPMGVYVDVRDFRPTR